MYELADRIMGSDMASTTLLQKTTPVKNACRTEPMQCCPWQLHSWHQHGKIWGYTRVYASYEHNTSTSPGISCQTLTAKKPADTKHARMCDHTRTCHILSTTPCTPCHPFSTGPPITALHPRPVLIATAPIGTCRTVSGWTLPHSSCARVQFVEQQPPSRQPCTSPR